MLLQTAVFAATLTSSSLVFTVEPPSVQSGQTARVCTEVPPSLAVTKLKAHLVEQVAAFFRPPLSPEGKLCGLIAVPLLTAPGTIRIEAQWTTGEQEQSASLPLEVRDAKGTATKLKVAPGIAHPSPKDEKQIARDREAYDASVANPLLEPQWTSFFALPGKGKITSG